MQGASVAKAAGHSRDALGFNAGVKVKTVPFDKVCSRNQRVKAGSHGRSLVYAVDAVYDLPDVSKWGRMDMRFSELGREKRAGNPLTDGKKSATDVFYNVKWTTQDLKTKGSVQLEKQPKRATSKKLTLRPTGGAIGDRYAIDTKHKPGPNLGKQISRAQSGKSGKQATGLASQQYSADQCPLRIRFDLVQARPSKLTLPFDKVSAGPRWAFLSQARGTPTASNCGSVPVGSAFRFAKSAEQLPSPARTDRSHDRERLVSPSAASTVQRELGASSFDAVSNVHSAFEATKRPLSRVVSFGPGFGRS
ncbi:hypothetical protein DIPPA_06695 [Diplonema papillatum]|nr:hypothetical protein DIPPA_06695 [Diplonema papillatum]